MLSDVCGGGHRFRFGIPVLLLIVGMFGAVIGSSQARAQDVTESDATVRFVHASPGAPNVDMLVDGQEVVQDLAFGVATTYLSVPGGDHKVQVVPTGQNAEAAIIDTDLNVDGGDAYVFLAMNRLADIEGKVYDVNIDDIDEGKARVRVIHASPDAGEIDLAVTGGDELFGDVDFTDATDYSDLDAGTYSLDVKGDDDRVLATAQNLQLTAGNVYDVIALGQVADNSLALLPLVTSVSVPCVEALGLQGGVEDACVRVVHAVPGGPDVDVYLNDSPVVQGLTFGTATEFAAAPGGDDRKIQIVPAGGTPGDGDLVESDVDLDGRFGYEIIATGEGDDVEITTAKLDLTPVADGQARIRVIHASPDAGGVNVTIADGPTLFEGVDFRDVTDNQTIDARSYVLQVIKDDTVALTGDLAVETGMVYDVLVIGRNDDGTLALLILPAPAQVREGEIASPEAQGTVETGTAEATVIDTTVEPGEGTVVGTASTVEVSPTATP